MGHGFSSSYTSGMPDYASQEGKLSDVSIDDPVNGKGAGA
jgi:hypothetical protein